MVQFMVVETNRNAQKYLESHRLSHDSRFLSLKQQ